MSTPNRGETAGTQPSVLGAMCHTRGLAEEDRELYHAHLQKFRDEYQPQGATEEHLAQSLADLSWRLNRVVALETNILSISYTPAALVDGLFDQAKALANLSLHSLRLSRQFERTVAQLRDLQKARRAPQQIHESKRETHVPAADGFVFSKPHLRRQDEKTHFRT